MNNKTKITTVYAVPPAGITVVVGDDALIQSLATETLDVVPTSLYQMVLNVLLSAPQYETLAGARWRVLGGSSVRSQGHTSFFIKKQNTSPGTVFIAIEDSIAFIDYPIL